MVILISCLTYLFPLFFVPFLIYKWLCASSTNSPPSPRKLPVLGNILQLGMLPHRSFELMSKQYGQLMLLHLGSVPVLIASSATAAREILKTHDLIFANRSKNSIADRIHYVSKDIGFAPYGEYWRQVRSISVVHLLSIKRFLSYRRVREEETSLMIEKIEKLCFHSMLVNLTDVLALLTNDITCRVVLGKKYSEEANGRNFQTMLTQFGEVLGSFSIGDYIPWLGWVNRVNGFDVKVKKVAKEFDDLLEGVVDDHRRKTDGDRERSSDFVDILLEIQKRNLIGFPIENETIKALILDMFSGGTDTTYTTLEWAMSELIRNPKTMDKLQTEIRKVAHRKINICEDDIVEMHYLKAVVKETFRLHPPTTLIQRRTTQDVKLMGYDIQGDTQVLINVWAIGRDPFIWEMADEFQPERFINCGMDFKGFNFELIPFGGGRRGCPGAMFSVAIIELALAKLMNRFNFALPDGTRGEDLDISETSGVATICKG